MSAKDDDCKKNSADKFYRTKKWKTTKNSRIKEDNNTCQICGKKYEGTSKFNVDHIIMRSLLPKDQWCNKKICGHFVNVVMGLNRVLKKALTVEN